MDALECRQCGGMDGLSTGKIHVLLEKAEFEVASLYDITGIGGFPSCQQPKYGSFTRPIPSNQADLVAGIYLEGHTSEYLGTSK